ncbi:MAG: ATP synthase F1 subunit epsilon [Bacteroidota bacterium]|nr:ATP synthase F1 subunit epsilon [Bacteroidota bacterium]
MGKPFVLRIMTPASVAYDGKALSVTCPGSEGRFQVLFNHAPLLATLDIGRIDVETEDGGNIVFATGGGIAHVLWNEVVILADSAERPEQIDCARAQAALDRARRRLDHPTRDVDVERARAAMHRALNRLKLAGG